MVMKVDLPQNFCKQTPKFFTLTYM